jgi:hypothetical protein
VNGFILYYLTNHPSSTAHGNRQMNFIGNLVGQLIGAFTSRQRTVRKRILLIGTAFPNLLRTLQNIRPCKSVRFVYREKERPPSRRCKQTTYKCKQCDLPLCRVGCFLEYHEHEMCRCKIRWVGYYMHIFIMNKMKKVLSFCLFSLIVNFFWRGNRFWCSP